MKGEDVFGKGEVIISRAEISRTAKVREWYN